MRKFVRFSKYGFKKLYFKDEAPQDLLYWQFWQTSQAPLLYFTVEFFQIYEDLDPYDYRNIMTHAIARQIRGGALFEDTLLTGY